jgi:lactate dehydrogenase-like 2-hydroxyacid dehydrogenase
MMNKPRILITRKLPDAVEQRAVRDYDVILNPQDQLLLRAQILERAQDAAGIVACHTETFDAVVIAALPPTIKVIANVSTGTDHVDLKAAAARGIVVTNTPGVLADATAEIALLLLLGAARRASEGERLVRAGQWSTWSPTFMLGTQVSGKRAGIIGMGGVGQATARFLRGLDMELHYHNRRQLPPEQEQGATYHASLDTLLPLCDVLLLHCPATPETHHLINRDTIAQLPDGAIIVNVARGSVVHEADLIAALRSGKLAAAGLDVFENEPHINPEFATLDNVFLLPHLGSATRETRDAMGFLALDNLAAVLAGQPAPNQVN